MDFTDPSERGTVNIQEKASDYIIQDNWNMQLLIQVITIGFERKLKTILLSMQDIQDKITRKFTQDGQFDIKTAIWANNDSPFASYEIFKWYLKSKLTITDESLCLETYQR